MDDNEFDEGEDTGKVTVERTEDPVVVADGTEELSVLIVAEGEVGIGEVL